MSAPPPPTLQIREDWADSDFDIPDGVPLHAPSDRDDDEDEDWDLEMDLGPTGGAKVKAVVAGIVARSDAATQSSFSSSGSQMITIRPPIASLHQEDDDDEGVSTIKATDNVPTLKPKIPKQPLPQIIDEDFEDGFALPSDLTKLSLVPQSLTHRSSKNSLEWGDKDSSTSSSQSSDAYSTLGFADASPHSHSGTSVSLPDTETEEEEDDLEGLVIPNSLFESKQSVRHLNKILETKKKTDLTNNAVKIATPNPEEDFEAGLIIEDDVDLSPSRLLTNSQQSSQRTLNRSSNASTRTSSLRPPSRPKLERSKSPSNPPLSSQRQLQKIRLSPSPPLRPPSRSQTFQAFGPPPPIPSPTPSPSSSFLTPKPGSLRGQKSHSGLKPPTPPSTVRKLTRKASLSVIESGQKQSARTSVEVNNNQPRLARYEEPTVASKAKSHKGSTSRMNDFKVPPTRPCTPSSNTAALRLTMPTQSRLKSRPALSQLFAQPPEPQTTRSISPLPPAPRPPSSTSLRASTSRLKATPTPASPPPVSAPKLLRKPKRLRTYGDGTELDGFDDLPLDQDKEGRFRVQPKGYGNRIPGQSFDKPFSKSAGDKPSESRPGTIRRMKGTISSLNADAGVLAPAATNTLRRTAGIDFAGRPPSKSVSEVLPKKRKNVSSPSKSPATTRRKPTLIRNLGGDAGPKVVGDMKYNPATQRWEGNDQVLREFDAAMGTSTRPALITPLASSTIGSPSGNFANGARVVGNMYFDPQQMRWISTLPPDEEEPDVFANMADDEEDSDAWEGKSGTIRASTTGPRTSDASSVASGSESADARMASPSPLLQGHSRTLSDSGSDDRGSRASMYVGDIDEEFIQKCRQAEERHRVEMKGWKTALSRYDPHQPPSMSHLYEIRALATRKY